MKKTTQFKKNLHKNQDGSILVNVVVYATFALAMVGVSAAWIRNVGEQASQRSRAEAIRRVFESANVVLGNPAFFANAPMLQSCLKGTTLCPATDKMAPELKYTSFAPPVPGQNVATFGGHFSVNGFKVDPKYGPCNGSTFSDTCPLFLEARWWTRCTDGSNNCPAELSRLQVDFRLTMTPAFSKGLGQQILWEGSPRAVALAGQKYNTLPNQGWVPTQGKAGQGITSGGLSLMTLRQGWSGLPAPTCPTGQMLVYQAVDKSGVSQGTCAPIPQSDPISAQLQKDLAKPTATATPCPNGQVLQHEVANGKDIYSCVAYGGTCPPGQFATGFDPKTGKAQCEANPAPVVKKIPDKCSCYIIFTTNSNQDNCDPKQDPVNCGTVFGWCISMLNSKASGAVTTLARARDICAQNLTESGSRSIRNGKYTCQFYPGGSTKSKPIPIVTPDNAMTNADPECRF